MRSSYDTLILKKVEDYLKDANSKGILNNLLWDINDSCGIFDKNNVALWYTYKDFSDLLSYIVYETEKLYPSDLAEIIQINNVKWCCHFNPNDKYFRFINYSKSKEMSSRLTIESTNKPHFHYDDLAKILVSVDSYYLPEELANIIDNPYYND